MSDPNTIEDEGPFVYGELDEAFLDHPLQLGLSPAGAATRTGCWRPWPTTVRGFLNALSEHKAGEKDGNCFLQGEPLGGLRTSNSIPHLDILVLDLDTGESIEGIRARLQELGLMGVIYTTHSHLKPISDVKRDAVVNWLGDGAPAPDLDTVKAYLTEVKRYRPEILEGAELLPQQHTAEGVRLFIKHKPMPKFRVVLFLKERFVIADRANTQAAAITEWKERYAGTSKLLGAFFDRTCVDPSRLFYTPRHPKTAKEWRIEVIAGKPLDIETVERVTAEEVRKANMSAIDLAAEEMRSGGYRTANLKRFAAKYIDRFDVETFLLEADPSGDRGPRASGLGRTHRCPNDEQHTNAGDEGDAAFFCVNACDSDTGGAVASCRHDSCAGLDRLNFIDLACQAAGIDDAMSLKKWVPELVDEPGDDDKPEAEKPGTPEEGREPNRAYSNASEAKRAVKALTDAAEAGPIAVNIGMSGFSPSEIDELCKLLAKKSGLGVKALKDEVKLGRAKVTDADDEVTFDDDVCAQLARLNREYAAVLMGGKFRIMREPERPGQAPEMMDRDTFAAWMEHIRVKVMDSQGNAKLSPIAAEWSRWKERRMYQKVVFNPSQMEVPGAYNIWKGFATKPRKGDWSLLRGHIFDNICLGNVENFNWLMTWLAQIFQQPGRKLGTAVVIKGKKGTGKSVLFEWIRKAMGEPALKVSRKEEIVGGFNKHQQGLVLLVCEEAFWAGDTQAGGVLKDLITSEDMLLTPKGIDSIRFDSYMRLAMISNENWIVPASAGDERRYFVLQCGDARKDDSEFFAAMEKQMLSGGLEAMVYEFMHWDPSVLPYGWDSLRKAIQTPWLTEQVQNGLPMVDRFFHKIVDNGCFFVPDGQGGTVEVEFNESEPNYIMQTQLEEAYTKFISQTNSGRQKIGEPGVFERLAQDWLLAAPELVRTDKANGNYGKDRKRCFKLPALAEIREHIIKVKKLPFTAVVDDVT